MQDQVAAAAVDQEVFPAPLDRNDRAARERADLSRHSPAQARLAHLDTGDRSPAQVGLDAQARDLDFG